MTIMHNMFNKKLPEPLESETSIWTHVTIYTHTDGYTEKQLQKMCLCMGSYTYINITSFCSLRGPRNTDIPVSMSIHRSLFLNTIFQIKGISLLWEMTDSGVWQGKYKMSLEHPVVQKVGKNSKNNKGSVKGTQEPTWRSSQGQIHIHESINKYKKRDKSLWKNSKLYI